MNRVEWEESCETDDHWATVTITVVTDDPALLARARKALRMILDDSPRLAAVPRRGEDENA